jgi:hypothetical protein
MRVSTSSLASDRMDLFEVYVFGVQPNTLTIVGAVLVFFSTCIIGIDSWRASQSASLELETARSSFNNLALNLSTPGSHIQLAGFEKVANVDHGSDDEKEYMSSVNVDDDQLW